ncbi:MAG: hypothetical protein E4H21_11735 [Thermodesulfobacteriales bacterium]|nr:MAG: hypothetical protein E4H21_11735 [Thermodesulfobacteriales bacterium]
MKIAEKKGFNGNLIIHENHIEIERTYWNLSSWLAGLHGTHSFHFSDIRAINFKKRGLFVGWIKFDVSQRNPDFVHNDYAVTFESKNAEWENFYEYVKEMVYSYKDKQRSIEKELDF